jgi:hypothetical protein
MNSQLKKFFVSNAMVVAAALMILFLNNCKGKGGVALVTYSIKGQIEVVNDCSGNGADNDLNVDVTAKFFYKPVGPNFGRQTQAVVMVLAGVTTKGNYNMSDIPTNQELDHIELEIEEQCFILCPSGGGKCTNGATNTNPKNIKPAAGAVVAEYDYRFSCSCK